MPNPTNSLGKVVSFLASMVLCVGMMPNVYELLNRHLKATKLANYLEPKLQDSHIPISLLSDMSAEWWAQAAADAGAKAPSRETVDEVCRLLHDRQKARQESK